MKKFLSKLLEPRTNGPEMAEVLATLLKVKVSSTTLIKEIEEHPNYPSLLSISDVIGNYGIENIGVRFDISKMSNLPVPFVTQLEGLKSSTLFFTVVKEVKEKNITFYDPERHGWDEISIEEFNARCSRIALLVEAQETAGEIDYRTKRSKEKKRDLSNYAKIFAFPMIVAICSSISVIKFGAIAVYPVLYLLITLFGAGISALLVFYELDIHNPALQKICSAGRKVNCGSVLRSKGAKVFGISWSSIGFTYFMGILLFFLFSGLINPVALFGASWISSVAVSYVLFSIYYQWRITRQWCVLCLSVQALLIIQCLLAVGNNWPMLSSFEIAIPKLTIPLLCSFTIPFLTVLLLIPALKKAKESKGFYNELQKLKHNRQIFETLLQKQKKLVEHPVGLGILLGNKDAEHKLIKVCNPYCGPCSKAHKPMEELLASNPNVQIQILFTASNNEGDIKTPPVKHLLAIAEKNSETVIKTALDDWYLAESKNYESFAAKYPMNGELQRQESKIVEMKNWCDSAVISFTPMFFVSSRDQNDDLTYHQLPEIYTVSDLKYFFSA
jgi:uncharacterized membrane protein